ncbi:TetR/AcrR family transcriptional regulator [Sphaerisporangium fuscum]|uniref:TetR/AcrR family transcriptional regulator n=1 Tax=Sphaerisporangium fuscum TaxID=2835868 RepID=UPI001BDCE23A|nr:TetR/AcrR family transcriptional regulator [Sphaerisporangium fuscum]
MRRPAGERRRDPERTKERILRAAVEEFGAKGFAGARVSDIAANAGVNKQLISYYFGGKEGLYRELTGQWQSSEGTFAARSASLPELAASYVRGNAQNRDFARMLVWDGLTDDGGALPEGFADDMRRNLEDLRRRQAEGEFPADLDPACLLLVLFAAAGAGVALPHLVRAVCDTDPGSEEFTEHYAEQVRRLVAHLRV